MSRLKEYITRENPSKLFIVGDFVTHQTVEKGINADIYIIDYKIMRKPSKTILPDWLTIYKIKNPPGTISAEAWKLLEEIINSPAPSAVIVEGEEDLLTLLLIKFAPYGAFVVYGQPYVVMVLVRVTKEKQREIEKIITRMNQVSLESSERLK